MPDVIEFEPTETPQQRRRRLILENSQTTVTPREGVTVPVPENLLPTDRNQEAVNRQVVAGFMDTFLPSPAATGGERLLPTAVTGLVGLPGLVGDLTGSETLQNLPFQQRAKELIQARNEATNQELGIENPKTLEEMFYRNVVGGTPLPITKGGATGNVVREVTEALVPLVTKPSVARVGAGIALPTAVEYGVSEALGGGQPKTTSIPSPSNIQFEATPDIQFEPIQQPQQAPDIQFEPTPSVEFEPTPEPTFFNWIENKFGVDDAAIGLLAILGGNSIRRQLKGNKIRTEIIDTGLPNPEQLARPLDADLPQQTGFAEGLESATTPQEALQTIVQDATGVLTSQFGRANPLKQKVDDFKARVSGLTRSGGNASIHETFNTGIFSSTNKLVDSTGKGFSPREWMTAYRQVTDNERQILSEYLLAKDVQDSRAIALKKQLEDGKPIGTTPAASATNWDGAALNKRIQAIEDYPHLKDMADRYWRMGEATLRYMKDNGIITSDTFSNLRKERPHYMPNIAVDPQGNFTDRLTGKLKTLMPTEDMDAYIQNLSSLRERNLDTGTGVQQFLNPSSSIDHYMTTVMSYTNRKVIQREFIDEIVNSNDDLLRNSVKKITRTTDRGQLTKPDPSNTLEIIRNGEVERYQFADPLVKTALDLNAVMAKGGFNVTIDWMRRIKQRGLTGAWQPLFAPIAAIYDASFGAVSRDRGRTMGAIDYTVNALSGGRFGVRGDPTALMTSALGIPRDLSARMLDTMSNQLSAQLQSNTGFARMSPEVTRRVADGMRNMYLNSSLAMLRKYGGYNTSLLVDSEKRITAMMKNGATNPALFDLGRTYMAILESVHNAPRLQFFAQNYKPGMDEAALRRLANETRSLSADMSKKGLGKTQFILRNPGSVSEQMGGIMAKLANNGMISLIRDGVPYGNVTIQATTKLGKNFLGSGKAQMAAYATGVANVVAMPMVYGAYLMSNASEEHRNYYWNEAPAWMRASHVALPTKDPRNPIWIPIPPELASFGAMALGGADSLLNLSQGVPVKVAAFADSKEALAILLNVAEPPALGVGLAATGQQLSAYQPLQIEPIKQEGLSGAGEGRTVSSILPANVEQMITELTGSAGMMAVSVANAGAYGNEGVMDNVTQQLNYEGQAKATRPALGLWGLHKENLNDPVSRERFQKAQVARNIMDVYIKTVVNPPQVTGAQPPKITNQAFLSAGAALTQVTQQLLPIYRMDGQLRDEVESLKADLPLNEEKQEAINELTRQRREIGSYMVNAFRDIESELGVELEDLDPFGTAPIK